MQYVARVGNKRGGLPSFKGRGTERRVEMKKKTQTRSLSDRGRSLEKSFSEG